MKNILLAALLCLGAASPVLGQADVSTGPYSLTLEAYIADKPPSGVKPSYVWTVGQGSKTYTLQIVKHESLSTTMSTSDIDQAVMMYKPNFLLGGDFKAIDAFTSAKPDKLMKISAMVRTSPADHRLELNTVTPAK